ncbi:hypothetical protein GVN21_07930 [Caulobacter sp. SLTY]|uniref:hypothetical protein n=1 Tax=Caulobacter sp. SLTY TaxID=2683262 RepID=UPI0014136EDB|nr:hypothetical protein [Caulobacter sp. SLTY]NBB15282.1 hypothetical protein [Caulobacter sp. SLTY]
MIMIAMGLLLAVSEGPPPYPQSLNCAGLTMAWSQLEDTAKSEGAVQAREDAEFWAFALMDAARRDGKSPRGAEADYDRVTQEAGKRFDQRDANASRELLDCQLMIPTRKSEAAIS